MLKPSPAHTRIALLLIWMLPALWAVNLIVARKAPGVVPAHVLALGRWTLAGLILGWVARSELWQQRGVLRANAWRLGVLGACGMCICGAWVYLAGQSTQAMNISLIYASSPVLIALGSVYLLGERFSHLQKLGVVLALGGVLHVLVRGEWLRLTEVQLVPGDLWVVGTSIAWAAYSLLQRHWRIPLSSTALLAASCMAGVVVLLPFAGWELWQASTPALGLWALSLMALAALVPGVMAYWIYGWTQKILGVGPVAVTMYLGPLYAAMTAWLFLNEPLGWSHATGGALILLGVGLVMTFKHK